MIRVAFGKSLPSQSLSFSVVVSNHGVLSRLNLTNIASVLVNELKRDLPWHDIATVLGIHPVKGPGHWLHGFVVNADLGAVEKHLIMAIITRMEDHERNPESFPFLLHDNVFGRSSESMEISDVILKQPISGRVHVILCLICIRSYFKISASVDTSLPILYVIIFHDSIFVVEKWCSGKQRFLWLPIVVTSMFQYVMVRSLFIPFVKMRNRA